MFTHASRGNLQDKFVVRGRNVEDMVTNFRQALAAAGAANDYSNILSPDRDFIVYVPISYLDIFYSLKLYPVAKLRMAVFDPWVLALKLKLSVLA